MCRYAFVDYKEHFACFGCRKIFKKQAIVDWAAQKGLAPVYEKLTKAYGEQNLCLVETETGTSYRAIRDQYFAEVSKCPQCGNEMAAMGRDFRAPALSDREAWLIVKSLYEQGFAFRGCGCSVGYGLPEKLKDLPEFFRQHRRQSEGEKLLEQIAAASGVSRF